MKKAAIVVALGLVCAAGCSKHRAAEQESAPSAAPAASDTSPLIAIDGSSTVFPILEAAAEEFQKGTDARVTIGVSGTGGGFKKFCNGETQITGASRPIRPVEREQCRLAGIEYIELPIAYDGIAVVAHKDAVFADPITVEELKKIWEPAAQNEIKRWNQVREGWPDQALVLFGPGIDSGTYDYFTAAIVGDEHASRGDFTSSEDDNTVVQGVATAPGGLGFFGFAYYAENKDKLRLLGVDPGTGPVKPSAKTISEGSYQPLSRPVFIYVRKRDAADPAVKSFVDFILDKGQPLVTETGYIPLTDKAYALVQQRFREGVAGTLFAEGSKIGVTVESLLAGQ